MNVAGQQFTRYLAKDTVIVYDNSVMKLQNIIFFCLVAMLGFGAGCDKTKKKIPRLQCKEAKSDRAGRQLPPCGADRLGTYRPRFGEQVTSVAFSPNGRIIAAGGKDRLARFGI